MERIINKKDGDLMLVKSIDVGTNGHLDYSHNLVRIGFIQSFSSLNIIPILHRNSNKFMGMGNTDDYLAYKVIKDKMIALTKKGVLVSWNITTAKLIRKYDTKIDFSEWRNHSHS